jgi:general secretion pathway protein J
LPAFAGAANRIEFTRLGFANPQAETRSNLERVSYELDDHALKRGRYRVLDRAASSAPELAMLRGEVDDFRLRYLDAGNRWSDSWPPQGADPAVPPRAVEWHLLTRDYGEIVRVVELVSQWPKGAAPPPPPPGPPTPGTTPTNPNAPISLPPPPGGVK